MGYMAYPFTVLFTVVSLFYLPYLAASRASFGESCSKFQRCDSRNFLSCSSSNICECFMADSMVYDDIAGKCVALAGERCLFSTVEGESNLIVQLPCVSNGTCTDGACECLSSHYELSNGTCSRKKSFGGMCTSNLMCDSSEHLTCGEDKTCVCDASRGLILEGNECKLLAGSSCSIQGAECISGASCNSSNLTCQCEQDKFQAVNGSCIPKGNKGDSCSSNMECLDTLMGRSTFLTCQNGQCICDPGFAVEDNLGGGRICRKQLGHLCSENDCINGANCIDGVCQCVKSTYFQTENQTCESRRRYRGDCASDGECISSLQCLTNGKCGCSPGTAFSITSDKCVVSAESACRQSRYHGDIKECVPNAECEQSTRYNPHVGYYFYDCQCTSGFKSSINGDGLCYVKEGERCNSEFTGRFTSKQCLPGLVCRDGRCSCLYKNHQSYSYKLESCKSSIGGPCNNSSDCSGDAAVCSAEMGTQQCTCTKGYNQVGMECKVSFGGSCDLNVDVGTHSCDKVAGLECTYGNISDICKCPPLQEYNAEAMSCKGLVGEKCRVEDDKAKGFCRSNSFCKPFRGSDGIFGLCTCSPGYKADSDKHCILIKDQTLSTLAPPTLKTTGEPFYQSDG